MEVSLAYVASTFQPNCAVSDSIYIKYTQIYIYHCPASDLTVRFTQIYIKYNFYINFTPDAKRHYRYEHLL